MHAACIETGVYDFRNDLMFRELYRTFVRVIAVRPLDKVRFYRTFLSKLRRFYRLRYSPLSEGIKL